MEKRPSPAELLRSLISQNNYSLRELDRFYRMLSKRCHPDATGRGSGDDFIELRKVYEEAAARIMVAAQNVQNVQSTPAAAQQGPDAPARPLRFDPLQLVREAGYDHRMPPRGCLYISLQAFFSSGMHNYRIRAMHGLKRRNTGILRSIFHWSRLYDADFTHLFSAYSRHTLQFLSTTWEIKNYNYAKQLFLDGVRGFFNYQHSGRKGTAEVARDKFSWCAYTLQRVIKIEHPMAPLAEWFAGELDKDPVFRDFDS